MLTEKHQETKHKVKTKIVLKYLKHCITVVGFYFTCQCVQMFPYLGLFQIRFKDMGQGLRYTIHATENIEQCDYKVISSLAAFCRYLWVVLRTQIWKMQPVSVRDKTSGYDINTFVYSKFQKTKLMHTERFVDILIHSARVKAKECNMYFQIPNYPR